MSIDSELGQIDAKIYANSHAPSWQTLKHHLFLVGITKKLSRRLEILAVTDKKGEFKHGGNVRGVSGIPIANTISELEGMDFVY